MARGNAQEEGGFGDRHKADAMVKDQGTDWMHLAGFPRQKLQLVACHRLVGFVIDPHDPGFIFQPTHHAPEIQDGSGLAGKDGRQQTQRRAADDDINAEFRHNACFQAGFASINGEDTKTV